MATVGEGGENPVEKKNQDVLDFVQWYTDVTENACNYGMEQFRASKLGRVDEKRASNASDEIK